MKTLNCPNGHGEMLLEKSNKSMKFRGVDITYPVSHYKCQTCDVEAGTVEQTAATQRAISEAYRKEMGLLTGEEIRHGRKNQNLSQAQLAKKMDVGIASIKRWEGGLIQSRSMDKALRIALKIQDPTDYYAGNRPFSIPRVKLVLRQFEHILGKKILIKNDRMLFAAKYLWYADMVTFRDLGCSISGATYAALPKGPQLNNYVDLIDEIDRAKEEKAEPLTMEEKRVIEKIAQSFPNKWDVYNATHQEVIWQRRSVGELIPYGDAYELIKI